VRVTSPPVIAETRRRADAVRNRVSVLTAATDVFAEFGLEARMEDIARRAGVGVGTVYRHFPTKEALLGELLAEKWRTLRDTVQDALDNEPDPWQAFSGALTRNAEIMAADAAVRGALMSDQMEVWEHASDAHQELMVATAELIRRGRDAGVLRDDLGVDDVPAMMCGVSVAVDARGPAGEALNWRRHLELVLDGTRRRPE